MSNIYENFKGTIKSSGDTRGTTSFQGIKKNYKSFYCILGTNSLFEIFEVKQYLIEFLE